MVYNKNFESENMFNAYKLKERGVKRGKFSRALQEEAAYLIYVLQSELQLQYFSDFTLRHFSQREIKILCLNILSCERNFYAYSAAPIANPVCTVRTKATRKNITNSIQHLPSATLFRLSAKDPFLSLSVMIAKIRIANIRIRTLYLFKE